MNPRKETTTVKTLLPQLILGVGVFPPAEYPAQKESDDYWYVEFKPGVGKRLTNEQVEEVKHFLCG